MSLKQYLLFIALFGVLSVSLSGAPAPPEQDDSAAAEHLATAVVEGHTIWTSDVATTALRRYGQEILDGLIDDYLIEHESKRFHVIVSETEIDHQVEAIKPKTLDEGLKQHHQTLAQVRDDFRRHLLALKLAATGAPPGHFVHANVILTTIGSGHPATRTTAFQKKLAAATDLKNLASQYNHDQSTAARREDIGIVFQGSPYDAQLVEAALELKAGQILDKPLQTHSRSFLIKAVSTDSEHPAEEDSLYSEARGQYEMRQGTQNLPTIFAHCARRRLSSCI